MTEEERQQFVDELRRLGPLFEKSGIADVFIDVADANERLARSLRQALMNPFRRDAAEATLEAAEEAGLVKRVAIAQPYAERKMISEKQLVRPDASAGLIEALKALVIDCENKWGDPHTLAEARAALAQSDAEPNNHEHWLLMQSENCLKTLGWDGSEDPPREEWARNLASEVEDMRATIAQSNAEPVAWKPDAADATAIECAIGGKYEMPDGRSFWIDAPVAREMTRRVIDTLRARAADRSGPRKQENENGMDY